MPLNADKTVYLRVFDRLDHTVVAKCADYEAIAEFGDPLVVVTRDLTWPISDQSGGICPWHRSYQMGPKAAFDRIVYLRTDQVNEVLVQCSPADHI